MNTVIKNITIIFLLVIFIFLSSCNKTKDISGITLDEPITATVKGEEVKLGDIEKNGVEIIIPANALETDSIFTLKLAENSPTIDKTVGNPIGAPIEIDIEGDIKRFDEPITISFKLTEKQWNLFENPNDIHIGYFDGYNWVYLSPTSIDEQAKTVMFLTYHCSEFFPSSVEKEEMKRAVAKSLAIESVTIDKDAELKKTTESLVKSVMGPEIDKSLLQDIVEGIMDQNDFTQLAKAAVNYDSEEIEEKFIASYTQVVASNLSAYAKNANNLGDLGANLGLVGSFGKSSSHFLNSNYDEVAKELARGVISTHPVGKLLTSAVKVTERQISRWKNEEIEAAYKIYINGKEPKIPFWGYGSIEPGDFDEIWNQMRGVGRQIIIDAVADFKKVEKRNPTDEERAQIELDAKETLENEFKNRKEKEAAIADAEKKTLEFLKYMEEGNLLTAHRYGYDTDLMSYKDRVKMILNLQEKVLKDTNRKMNINGDDTETEINVYTVWKLLSEYLGQGEEKYNEMLVELKLVKELDMNSISGTYTTPLYFDNTALSNSWIAGGGMVTVVGNATIGESEATISITPSGIMSIYYSVNVNSSQMNTVAYEVPIVEYDYGTYTITESYSGMQINMNPGAVSEFKSVLGDYTYYGHEDMSKNRSWDISPTYLNSRLESVIVKVSGESLTIVGRTNIDIPLSNVGGFNDSFNASFSLTLDKQSEVNSQ
ncbi:MAG: hypothetical protein GX675_03825 [Erysipelotrichaceae bacterium]|nr:hypothetical protein [Erysipelotrichaceae bacterium]